MAECNARESGIFYSFPLPHNVIIKSGTRWPVWCHWQTLLPLDLYLAYFRYNWSTRVQSRNMFFDSNIISSSRTRLYYKRYCVLVVTVVLQYTRSIDPKSWFLLDSGTTGVPRQKLQDICMYIVTVLALRRDKSSRFVWPPPPPIMHVLLM